MKSLQASIPFAKTSTCRTCVIGILLLLLTSAHVTNAAEPAQKNTEQNAKQGNQQEVHNRMNELVDSVKDAVRDADAAANKKQVVDLGQSLSLLEGKFTGLRAALAQELGVSKGKLTSHSTVSRELMDKSTDLVKGVVSQREELRRLSGDLKETDSAIRALREGLSTFEKEMANLNRIMGDVHETHNELSSSHDEIRNRVSNIVQVSGQQAATPASHRVLYIVLAFEMVAFCAFCYFKRPGRPSVHKSYGKFG